MIPGTDEQRLLRGLRTGGEQRDAALRELFDATRGPIFGIALRMTGRPELADDAVQETFVDLLRGIDGFRGEAQLTTWLYRVAVRAAARVAGRAERRGDILPDELAAELAGNDTDPAAHAEQRDGAARILAAITALPAPQRAVVALNAVDGLPLTEVAAVLGVPEGTVHSRLHAARAKLRKRLSYP